jgi:DNA-binding IclR family transcriptional regulator
MDIVRTVAQIQRSGATLSRVAVATGFSTPTTYRLLRSLTEEGLLRFDDSRCYHLGPLAFELGLAAAPRIVVGDRWQEVVSEVARRTRLTSYLIARSNDEAVCLFCLQGSAAIRAMPMEVGQRVPLRIGAGSLAILASLDDAEVARILDHQLRRYEAFAGGAQTLGRILERVAQTRDRGYSISTGTVAKGVTGLGVGVSSARDQPSLAVTVSAVASTFDTKEAEELCSIIRAASGM